MGGWGPVCLVICFKVSMDTHMQKKLDVSFTVTSFLHQDPSHFPPFCMSITSDYVSTLRCVGFTVTPPPTCFSSLLKCWVLWDSSHCCLDCEWKTCAHARAVGGSRFSWPAGERGCDGCCVSGHLGTRPHHRVCRYESAPSRQVRKQPTYSQARPAMSFRPAHGSSCRVSLLLCRVRLVERGSPHSLPLMESGKVTLLKLFRFSAAQKTEKKSYIVFFVLGFCSDPPGCSNHHRQPGDQGTNGRVPSWGGALQCFYRPKSDWLLVKSCSAG